MKERLALVAGLGLGLVGLALALLSVSPAGPATALAFGALVGAGGVLSPLLALVAVGVALGQQDMGAPGIAEYLAAVAGGVFIGLLARVWERGRPYLTGAGALGTATLLAGAAAVAAVLPDDQMMLADSSGGPLMASVVVQNMESMMKAAAAVPVVIHQGPPLDWLLDLTPIAAIAAIFLLIAGAWLEDARWRKLGFYAALGCGALVAVPGLAGLVQAAAGSAVTLPPTEELAGGFFRAAAGRVAVGEISVPEVAAAGFLSRPGLDVLRLVLGSGLLALALLALRQRSEEGSLSRGAGPELPLALVAGLIAAWFASIGVAIGAAVLLTVAAGAAGMLGGTRPRLAYDLVLSAVLVNVYAWLAPLSGWLMG